MPRKAPASADALAGVATRLRGFAGRADALARHIREQADMADWRGTAAIAFLRRAEDDVARAHRLARQLEDFADLADQLARLEPDRARLADRAGDPPATDLTRD